MPLTGQAKMDYQRAYMRKRRSNAMGLTEQVGSNEESKPLDPLTGPVVRPLSVLVRPEPPLESVKPKSKRPGLIRPVGKSDSQWAYIQMKAEQEAS